MIKKILNFLYAMLAGHFTVLKNAFRKRVTLEYPEKKNALNDRFRGKIEFNYDENGVSPCTACGICQRVCPCKDLIKIERSKLESGKFKLEKYQIDLAHCIFCGNCVEHCPENALSMSKNYELASSNKEDLIITLKGI